VSIDPNNLSGTARLSFVENFDSLDLWNGQHGRWATNFWWSDTYGAGSTLPNNGEQQWYINSNYAPTAAIDPWTVNNGVLTLTASRVDPWVQGSINGYQYASGMLNTFHSFEQTYGYFEMRAQMPAGQGTWPAFWMLPASGVTPPPELDIVEVLGRDPGTVHTALHRIDNGVYADIGHETKVGSTSDGFHTYGVNWQPDTITWYFDGRAIAQTATSSDMHQPMYMIVNLALGGHWGGMVNGSTPLPAQMKVDYIRAYEDAGRGGPAPGGSPGAGGTAGADVILVAQSGPVLTGGEGADTFQFKDLPWRAGAITDFRLGVDKLDISALYRGGYKGSNPVGDGYLSFVDNGAGGTRVMLDVDGRGSDNPWAYELVNLNGVSPYGLTAAQVLGGVPAPGPSPGPGAGGPTVGADTFVVAQSGPVLTGGEGADTFVFKELPWRAGAITDFRLGVDKLDISALYRGGYHGSDPVADGYLRFVDNGSGGARVMLDVDGAGWDHPWAYELVNLDGVSPHGLTAAQVLGGGGGAPSTPPPASTPGVVIASRHPGDRLVGGSGDDTLIPSRGADVMTGRGGADTFRFEDAPWRAGVITDFTPGLDVIDMKTLFAQANYWGSNPVRDGYIQLVADGRGGTEVYFDLDGPGWYGRQLLTTLQHVEVGNMQNDHDWLIR
jgi:beta-glucanase (GH16 family)